MYFLSLLRRCRQPGPNRPDRLIRHNRFLEGSDSGNSDNMRQLPPHHLERLPRLPLFKRLAETQNRLQTTTQRRHELAANRLVTFTQHQPALGMTNQHPLATRVDQLVRRCLAREGAKPALSRA